MSRFRANQVRNMLDDDDDDACASSSDSCVDSCDDDEVDLVEFRKNESSESDEEDLSYHELLNDNYTFRTKENLQENTMVRSETVEMVPEESFSLHSGAFSIPVIEPKRIIDMNEYIYGPVTGHIVEIFGRQNKKKPICFFVGTVNQMQLFLLNLLNSKVELCGKY